MTYFLARLFSTVQTNENWERSAAQTHSYKFVSPTLSLKRANFGKAEMIEEVPGFEIHFLPPRCLSVLQRQSLNLHQLSTSCSL